MNGNCGLYIGSLIRRSSYVELERSHPDLVQEDWDMFLRLAKLDRLFVILGRSLIIVGMIITHGIDKTKIP